jgi:hypothetical protein
MAISKVIYGGETLIDLTTDSVKADKLLKGYTAHGADGEVINGACEYDAKTTIDNSTEKAATEAEILSGKTAFVNKNKLTGTMKNNGAVAGKITTKAGKYTIPQGYHDGSGTVQIDSTEQAKLIASNIRDGVTILGVEGNMSGSEDVKAQSKSVTPSTAQQIVLPEAGYTHLTQVTVEAIPYEETNHTAGGKTATIG